MGWVLSGLKRAEFLTVFTATQTAHNFGEKGFTLLELLVAVAILGILLALAIPQFNEYLRRGYVAAVKSDLKNASIVQEAYFAENETYTDPLPTLVSNGFRQSKSVSMSVIVVDHSYTFTAMHANCGADTWSYKGSDAIMHPTTPCQWVLGSFS